MSGAFVDLFLITVRVKHLVIGIRLSLNKEDEQRKAFQTHSDRNAVFPSELGNKRRTVFSLKVIQWSDTAKHLKIQITTEIVEIQT